MTGMGTGEIINHCCEKDQWVSYRSMESISGVFKAFGKTHSTRQHKHSQMSQSGIIHSLFLYCFFLNFLPIPLFISQNRNVLRVISFVDYCVYYATTFENSIWKHSRCSKISNWIILCTNLRIRNPTTDVQQAFQKTSPLQQTKWRTCILYESQRHDGNS